MHIPILSAFMDYLQGEGHLILPEIELTLFGLGILLIDFTLGVKERYLNAGLALLGTAFSAYTVWRLRIPVAANGPLSGFHDSVIVDPFFLFFAALFLPPDDLRAEDFRDEDFFLPPLFFLAAILSPGLVIGLQAATE